ncbi:MAG: CHAT domain-containing protein [Polyangiaceae bacterium]
MSGRSLVPWPVFLALGVTVVVLAGLSHAHAHRNAPALGHHARHEGTTGDLAVDLAGCRELLRGPACAVAPGSELRLWVPGSTTAPVTITADGRALKATTTPWPDGVALRVKWPNGGHVLGVRAARAGHVASWRIPIVAPRRGSEAVGAAIALRGQGKLDEAIAVLTRALDATTDGRDDVLSALANLDYLGGHIEEAVDHYHQATALRESLGRNSRAANDLFSLAFLLIERNRLGEARAAIAHAAELSSNDAEGRAEVAHYEGRIAWRSGDLRLALRRTRDAERLHMRLGSTTLLLSARLGVALLLSDLGRTRETVEAYRQLLDAAGTITLRPCVHADYLEGLGYAEEQLADQEPEEAAADTRLDPLEPLHAAIDLYRTCNNANQLANALHDVAHVELARGHVDAARASLAEARRVARDPKSDVILESLHLEGMVDLAAHTPVPALAAFEREDAFAAALGTTDDQRLAAEDRARALVALGRSRDALAAVQAADAIVEANAALIPLGEGKDTFLGSRDVAAMLEVDLLTQLGRTDEAVAAASRVGSRLLAGLRVQAAVAALSPDARARWDGAIGRYRTARDTSEDDAANDWELPADKLAAAIAKRKENDVRARASLDEALAVLALPVNAPPAASPPAPPGTVELLYFPAFPATVPRAQAWLGFAREGNGSWRARRLGLVDPHAPPDELARELLTPFDDTLVHAADVRVRLYGAMRGVDVHALPWHGEPLLAHASVEYAIELSGGADALSGPIVPGHALLVADPRGDLPSARAEADVVERDLSADTAWRLDVLRGGAATGEAVRASLASAALLHYAGHASFGGPDGVESSLALAGAGELTPTDILALPRVPPLVSLFGCDTGRESASGKLETLGLANAFLAAGAETVIATSRPVDDALARDVAASFYAGLTRSPPLSPAAAMQAAALRVRSAEPGADWAAFRALVR